MDIKAVVFDLDHTLYDRAATLVKFSAVLESKFPTGLSEEELKDRMFEADKHLYFDDYVLAGQKNVHKYLSSVLPNPLTCEEYLYLFDHFFGSCATPYSFTYEVLQELRRKGLKLGMVTNGGPMSQNSKIETLQLRSYFEDILISGEVGFAKPDRRIYELAANNLGLPVDALLFVGDNAVSDAAGPMAAGLKAAWIRQERGWPSSLLPPDYVLQDIRDLLRIL